MTLKGFNSLILFNSTVFQSSQQSQRVFGRDDDNNTQIKSICIKEYALNYFVENPNLMFVCMLFLFKFLISPQIKMVTPSSLP